MFPVNDIQNSSMKFTSRAKAKVLATNDPQKRGRVQVFTPKLGQTAWLPYLQQPFMFDFPEPGDFVYVECDGGFETHPIAWGKLLTDQVEKTKLPEVFKREKPTNRGFYTPGGHLIEIDDGEESLGQVTKNGFRITTTVGIKLHLLDEKDNSNILIEHPNGQSIKLDGDKDTLDILTDAGNLIKFDPETGVIVQSATEDKITLGEKSIHVVGSQENKINLLDDGSISVEDKNGNKVVTSKDGINVEDTNGNKIETTSDGIVGSSSGGAVLNITSDESSLFDSSGAGVKSSNGKVALGGSSAEVVDILSTFLQELSTDTFAGQGAPAGKAAVYAQLASKLSAIKGSL